MVMQTRVHLSGKSIVACRAHLRDFHGHGVPCAARPPAILGPMACARRRRRPALSRPARSRAGRPVDTTNPRMRAVRVCRHVPLGRSALSDPAPLPRRPDTSQGPLGGCSLFRREVKPDHGSSSSPVTELCSSMPIFVPTLSSAVFDRNVPT